jgi:hypothetical protein
MTQGLYHELNDLIYFNSKHIISRFFLKKIKTI